MPTWLVYGFRWPRRAINIHVILHNLEDCAVGWLMAPDTSAELMDNFQTLYPDQIKSLPDLQFIEQYDPDDEATSEQPYAYVCEQIHEIRLGADVDDFKNRGIPSESWNALVGLRNELAPGEKIGWYIVVNGDVERWVPPVDDEEKEAEEMESNASSQPTVIEMENSRAKPEHVGDQEEVKKGGFKKWLGKVKKVRSFRDLKSDLAVRPSKASPLAAEDQPVPSPKRVAELQDDKSDIAKSTKHTSI
ncbi:unnamed protein product [Periconia digitata]|uniref:Developmental regulator protein n=1 Tax=Periconia digitata TaxID=1303443 RepID=A0A9W4UIB7_9PLEO|nr:unnamed protein product [Periconia digitata]